MSSQGPNNPSTATQSSAGTSWGSPSNVFAEDGAAATVAAGSQSRQFNVSGFGFSAPSDATVDGITVEIKRAGTDATDAEDISLRLLVAGVASGDQKANSGVFWPTVLTYFSYGGAADLWGLALTPADVNASNFGIAFRARSNKPGDGMGSVDHVRITVHYTSAAAGGAGKMVSLLGVG